MQFSRGSICTRHHNREFAPEYALARSQSSFSLQLRPGLIDGTGWLILAGYVSNLLAFVGSLNRRESISSCFAL